MYHRFRSVGAMFAMWLAMMPLYAQTEAPTAPDLYAASIPVAEQSTAELHRAAGAGLREVLIRISGQSDVVRQPALANALNDAERYLDQYRYERNNSGENGAPPWLARLRFGPNTVAQLLRGAGLPVWTGNRPALLVYLVFDDGKTRQFIDEQSAQANALREQAQRRGLTLRFPKDFSAIAVDDAWQMDASKAPAAPGGAIVLLGRVVQVAGGHWLGAWTLASNGQQRITGEGDNLTAYLAPSIDRVADLLAQQYAVVATSNNDGTALRVTGIHNFTDYTALLAYLKQIGAIKAATPTQIHGDEIILQLKLEGSAEQLARQLTLDNRLSAEVGDASATSSAPISSLNYRWQAARG